MPNNGSILITGANGFCASRLRLFLQKRWNVVALSHRELDVTDRDECSRVIRDIKPFAVVHSAAIANMGICEQKPDMSYRVNVLGTENLAIACRENGAKLIHFSTDQVYSGMRNTGPHREEESLEPRSVYGCQKKEAEERVAQVFDNFAAIRLTWMYDFPVRHLANSSNLLTLCRKAICADIPITLPSSTPRGITYVHEVIENIPRLFDAPNGIYNFGSAGDISTYEAAREIFTLAGAQSRVDTLLLPENEQAGKYADLRMDCDKAAQAGIHFSTTREGIHKAFEDYRWL